VVHYRSKAEPNVSPLGHGRIIPRDGGGVVAAVVVRSGCGYGMTAWANIQGTEKIRVAIWWQLAPHPSPCPGYISEVGMAWRGWEARGNLEGSNAAEIGDQIAEENIPLQRLQSADDIANTAVFLASDEASEITGDAINVGGGVVMD